MKETLLSITWISSTMRNYSLCCKDRTSSRDEKSLMLQCSDLPNKTMLLVLLSQVQSALQTFCLEDTAHSGTLQSCIANPWLIIAHLEGAGYADLAIRHWLAIASVSKEYDISRKLRLVHNLLCKVLHCFASCFIALLCLQCCLSFAP